MCAKRGLTRRREYVSVSSARPIASWRLNPLPATPFSGHGIMVVASLVAAAKVLHKASFSASER